MVTASMHDGALQVPLLHHLMVMTAEKPGAGPGVSMTPFSKKVMPTQESVKQDSIFRGQDRDGVSKHP